jgi:hypothetical protein
MISILKLLHQKSVARFGSRVLILANRSIGFIFRKTPLPPKYVKIRVINPLHNVDNFRFDSLGIVGADLRNKRTTL